MAARIWIVSALLVCLATLTGTALADSSMSWDLTGTNAPGQLPCSSAAPCVEVTLDVNANMATFTVSSLLSGWVIDSFGFNTASGVPALMSGGASGEIGPSSKLEGPGSFAQDGWGKFTYDFKTGKDGGSSGGDCVVTAGKPGPGCTFVFSLTSTTTLTLADFEVQSSGGSGSGYFAEHEASSSHSGYGGSTLAAPPPLSEPAALAVVVPGLLVAFGQFRRRVLL